jgi:hypothetical protein
MANVVRFYRGLKASYDATTTHANGIYFATDVGQILMNGVEYGGDSDKKVANVELNTQANGIVITYTDTTSTTLLFGKASTVVDGLMAKEDKEKVDSLSTTYNSNMPDDLQVTDNHGGIKKGVTAGELKTKTWAQLMDDILFPTVQPTVNAPSASVALSNGFSNNGIYEIGAAAPAAGTSVKGSFNRGTVTVIGQPNKNRAGALIEDESYVATGAGSQELPEKIVLGAMTYKYHAAYGEGDELVDSKGNKATVTPNPLSAGSIDSSNVTIYGTYPYFSNGVMASTSSNELSSLPASFVDNAKFGSLIRIDNNIQIAAKFASEAEHSTKARLYVPATKKVTAVKAMNALTGKFDVDFTAWEMLADTVNQTVQGTEVAYKVWTTTGGLQGGNQYLFTIANA